jgi:hypothetical protein
VGSFAAEGAEAAEARWNPRDPIQGVVPVTDFRVSCALRAPR